MQICQQVVPCLAKGHTYGGLELVRSCGAGPAALDLSVAANQELLKVPLDSLQAKKTWLAVLHPLPHWLGLFAVHVSFAEHGECNAVVDLAEALDIVVAAWVLAAELVAWKADDLEVGVLGLDV